jgi:hypothetical protein
VLVEVAPPLHLVVLLLESTPITVVLDGRRSLCLTRFGGHLILAEGRRKESRDGTTVEVSG